MLIKELKEVINTIPSEMDDFEMVYSEAESITGDTITRRDVPLYDIIIDSDSEKILLAKKGTVNILNTDNS